MDETAGKKQPRKLMLISHLCPGDVLTLTAAIESLHITYPGEYLTGVETTCSAIWEHNPHITRFELEDNAERLIMAYPSVHRSNDESVVFIAAYTEFLADFLDRPLKLRVNRPYLYLSKEERGWINQVRELDTIRRDIPFWLLCAGVKADYTTKQWPVESYQEIIDKTRGIIQWVQIGAYDHIHPDLRGVIDLRGKTSHRELIRLAWHAQGGLGPSTYLQHLMAAWQRPYICLLGGREPTTWVQYPKQVTLHTVGQLPCCRSKACWKSRVLPLGDSLDKPKSLCDLPVYGLQRPVGRCMASILPAEVLTVLERIVRLQ